MECIDSRTGDGKICIVVTCIMILMLYQTPFDGQLYELRVTCGPNYPNQAPVVRFVTRINLSCVDQRTGMVTSDLPAISNWHRNMTIEDVLLGIKSTMTSPQNRRLPQPAEGTMF